MVIIGKSFTSLLNYVEKELYKGYDPYDTLLSPVPFRWLGKWGPILATQFQKINPLNARPLLGIRKEYNPKAMGLFLQAYSLLFKKTGDEQYKKKAVFFFNWLTKNYSEGYSGYCWGYNFPWASPVKYVEAYVPSTVVTGFVCKGVWEYYLSTKDEKAKGIILSASEFIQNDLAQYTDVSGICISYTPVMKDICYNASLLAGEVLAMHYVLTKDENIRQLCIDVVNFVVDKQKESGAWNYSMDLETGIERKQIDFHQGYVLESIYEIKKLLNIHVVQWENAIKKGLSFYYTKQFDKRGRSYWRLPKEYPVDIHNQSQGIITFSKMKIYDPHFELFANTITEWTIQHMQSKRGFFYFRKNKLFVHKISYMRWSQAWMFLALSHLMYN